MKTFGEYVTSPSPGRRRRALRATPRAGRPAARFSRIPEPWGPDHRLLGDAVVTLRMRMNWTDLNHRPVPTRSLHVPRLQRLFQRISNTTNSESRSDRLRRLYRPPSR